MKFRKIVAMMLICMSSFSLLASCGKPEEQAAVTEKEEEEKDKKEDKESEEEESTGNTKKEDKEARKAYDAFLNGEETVYISENGIEGTYNLQELANAVSIHNKNIHMPDSVAKVNWEYIDCGQDGVSELALQLVCEPWAEYDSTSEENFIIKNTKEGLKVCYYGTGYYRTMVTVYDNGYVLYGGSGGASLYYEDWSVVNADGECKNLYTVETVFGLGELIIPPDELPSDMTDEISKDDYEYGDKYQLAIFRFPDENNEYPSSDVDWSYEEYVKSGYYLFEDLDGKEVKAPNDYVEKCADLGINILTEKEIDKMIESTKKDAGIDKKSHFGKEVVWQTTDTPEDIYSTAAQTKLMESLTGVWMDGQQNEDMTDVRFAVTDLNHNGRYEIIRCEDYEGDNTEIFSRSYIYEINEDMTSMSECSFDQSGEVYISFLPTEEEQYLYSIPVFYKEGEGKYYYIVPTVRYTGYGYDLLKIVVEIDDDGNAYVLDTIAKKESGKDEGDLYYVDGKPCDEYEYFTADSRHFPISEGYTEGSVSYDFKNYYTSDTDLLTTIRQNAGWDYYFSVVNEAP